MHVTSSKVLIGQTWSDLVICNKHWIGFAGFMTGELLTVHEITQLLFTHIVLYITNFPSTLFYHETV